MFRYHYCWKWKHLAIIYTSKDIEHSEIKIFRMTKGESTEIFNAGSYDIINEPKDNIEIGLRRYWDGGGFDWVTDKYVWNKQKQKYVNIETKVEDW